MVGVVQGRGAGVVAGAGRVGQVFEVDLCIVGFVEEGAWIGEECVSRSIRGNERVPPDREGGSPAYSARSLVRC